MKAVRSKSWLGKRSEQSLISALSRRQKYCQHPAIPTLGLDFLSPGERLRLTRIRIFLMSIFLK